MTGSNVDFASFTASNSLGEKWQSLFDIVGCFARKPGLFTGALSGPMSYEPQQSWEDSGGQSNYSSEDM